MKLNLSDLRLVSEKLFTHLEERGISSIELSGDYYWNIPKELKYNPYQEPTELDLGQLSADWENLTAILEEEAEPIGYALVWLSAVLQAIGETTID